MAHVAKYTRGGIQGLSNHLDRKTSNHSNKDIDVERTHLNYDLNQRQGDTLSRMNERLDEVYCMNRKDVKVVADWIVTLPKELEDKTADEQKAFFQETKNFLDKQYGEENNISANVHLDETTPHMHYAFMPVVYDKKKEREKVSAKLVLTRNHLKSFHDELDKHLRANIPQIYTQGVLNGQTVGVESVKELKQLKTQEKALNAEIDKLTKQRDDVQNEIKAKNKEVDSINFQTFDIEKKPVAFQKRYVKVDKDEFRDIERQASSATIYRNRFNEQKKRADKLQRENWSLNTQVKKLTEKLDHVLEPLKEKLEFADDMLKMLSKKALNNEVGLDEFYERFQNKLEEQQEQPENKPKIDRDEGPSL